MPEDKLNLKKLNEMYESGKQVDKQLFAEQRTNILLRLGDHYKKSSTRMFDNARSRHLVNKEQKIRLTKNHIHRITNIYQNQILEGNPSAQAVPFNEDELQDVKAAELNNAVLAWVKHTNNWQEKQDLFVHDFVVIGEDFGIIRYDYTKGRVVGKDEDGKEIRAGEFVIDRAFGFEMKRDPRARSDEEAKWWIRETVMDFDEFKDLVQEIDPDKVAKITDDTAEKFKVFDTSAGGYTDMNKSVLVKELFRKPNVKYPQGQYVMFTKSLLLDSDSLPFGIYPVVTSGFDEMTTSPRSTSIIRVCRPYQVEINRASSKMAEHQITLGDDKVFIQKGTKISNGGYIHGVRAFQVAGREPVIQQGRSGAQYLDYQISQVKELYEACNLTFVMEDKAPQGDPYQLLFTSMKDKKRFVKYVTKYERFEVKLFNTILKLAKHYVTEDHMIKIAGRSEAINIEEFKNIDEQGFEIKVVPQTGDVETKFGKMLTTIQTLQYAGSQLDPEMIGMLYKNLPFGNNDRIFSPLTVDLDNAENTILALDRGRQLPIRPNDKHDLLVNALSNRIKKSDFMFLPQETQDLYMQTLKQHEALFNEQQQMIKFNELGMIPSGGFLTTVNTSWQNPTTGQIQRLKIPSEAIEWLVQKLQTQGQFAEDLSSLPAQSQADLGIMNQQQTEAAQPTDVLTETVPQVPNI